MVSNKNAKQSHDLLRNVIITQLILGQVNFLSTKLLFIFVCMRSCVASSETKIILTFLILRESIWKLFRVAIRQLIQMVFFGFVKYSIIFSIHNTLASGTMSFHGSYHLWQLPVWPHIINIFRACDAVCILHTHYPTVLVSSDYVLRKSQDFVCVDVIELYQTDWI